MHTEKREDPLVDMGYEIRDINVKAIRNATIIFLAFSLVTAIAGGIIYYYMNPAFHRQVSARDRQLPQGNNPLLQDNITSKTDIMVLRRREKEALTGAPKQNENGSYTIPVEAAMRMVAQQGGKVPGVRENVGTASTRPLNVSERPTGSPTPVETGPTSPTGNP